MSLLIIKITTIDKGLNQRINQKINWKNIQKMSSFPQFQVKKKEKKKKGQFY